MSIPALSLVRRLPMPAARFAFRVYNKILRMTGDSHIATTFFGAKLHCTPTDMIQCTILYFGFWEPNISAVIKRTLKPGELFVDIGANIGYDTLLGSKLVGESGSVVSIEAAPRTYDLLRKNLALNSCASNVRAVNVAVSDRAGTVDLFEPDATNIGSTSIVRSGRVIGQVEALPLCDILTSIERRQVRLIKIDAEGAETLIVNDILENLREYSPDMEIIVETDSREVFDRMQAAGFHAWGIENIYKLEYYLRWRRLVSLQRTYAGDGTRDQDVLFTRKMA